MRFGPPAPPHDIVMPCVRMFLCRMHMPASTGRAVARRIVWIIGRSRLGLEQISQFRFGCGLGSPTTVRQRAPKLHLTQEGPFHAHQVCETARRVFRLAGKASHPDVLPRVIRVARSVKCCSILVLAGAESDTSAVKIWSAARLAKLEVGCGLDQLKSFAFLRSLAAKEIRVHRCSSVVQNLCASAL